MKNVTKHYRPGRKRISFDMPEYVYEDMKKAADKRMLTVTSYIIESIVKRLHQETYNIEE